MTLLEMYNGIVNSPVTELESFITSTDTTITVTDESVIPDAPNILVLGGDTDNPETVKLISKNGAALTVERGFQGIAQSWDSKTKISRNFTEYDYATLKYNVEVLGAKETGTDIQARREILDIKLKLDEMNIVDYLNKTGIGFYDLFEDMSNVDTDNTTAAVDTTATNVIFDSTKTLRMNTEKFDNFNNIELIIYDLEREELEVDNAVSEGNQIQFTVSSESIVAGDRFFYKGETYTVTGVTEA